MKCCQYKIKHFNKKITIERLTSGQNADGWDVSTWATYNTAYAIIKPMRTREKLEAMQLAAKVTHKIIIKYNSLNKAINTKDRILYNNRYFNIQGVVNVDEDNQYIQIDAQESAEAST